MTKRLVIGFSIIIILLESLLISYISYNDFIDLQIKTANVLMSDNSVKVVFKEDSIAPSLKDIIISNPNISVLSKIYGASDLELWGVYGNSFLDDKTNSLIEGTFFNKDDFFKKKFKAVVGKNILNLDNSFSDESGKKYFSHGDNSYEIIGLLSSNVSNMLDNTAFINLDSLNIHLNELIIDSTDKKSIAVAIDGLKKENNVHIVKEDNNLIERYIYNDMDKLILNILVITFAIMLIITLLMFTLHYYSDEIKVKRIIGISFKRILSDWFKDITILTAINTVFMIVIYLIVYYTFLKKIHISFYFNYLIILLAVILIVIYSIIYLYIVISNKLFYKNGVK